MDSTEYEKSHPWINFAPVAIGNSAWFLLGAAESKCKHMTGIPLPPDAMRRLLKVYMRKGVHATTAIEGNTLSLEDVGKIMDGAMGKFPLSQKYQITEVKNVVNACNNIAAHIDDDDFSKITPEQIKTDNNTILQKLTLKPEVVPGEIRDYPVVVQAYRGAPAQDCEYLLRRLCEWLNEDWGLGEDRLVAEGILKAILGHLYTAWIHPFGDGNGRTARMLELRLLMAAGIPMTAAHLLSNYYNETRPQYYNALARSSMDKDNGIQNFVMYALQGFVDALDAQIKVILSEQLDLIWVNYVHSFFSDKKTAALTRQKELLLDISRMSTPMKYDELKLRLSIKTLMPYKDKTDRAFIRDINGLLKANLLLKRENGKVAANKNIMRSFLPKHKRSQA
jgi:Fic family protein